MMFYGRAFENDTGKNKDIKVKRFDHIPKFSFSAM